jgi:membrane protein
LHIALFGASGVFGQLQDALNTIWDVKPRPAPASPAICIARFLSFALVAGICFLLLVSLTIETVLKSLSHYLQSLFPGGLILAMSVYLVSISQVVTLFFAIIFKFLPDAKVRWRDVWFGAFMTAVFFAIGKGHSGTIPR